MLLSTAAAKSGTPRWSVSACNKVLRWSWIFLSWGLKSSGESR